MAHLHKLCLSASTTLKTTLKRFESTTFDLETKLSADEKKFKHPSVILARL